MIADSTIITGNNDDRIQLVRGCPCLREFGEERVCLNNDDILPIKSITIDPHFFAQLESVEALRDFETDRDDLCYGLLNLDPRDGRVYCVSQGKAIIINSHYIRAGDVKEALNFVVPSQMGSDDVVCSACLYKYLVTLTDVFEGILSDSEKRIVILSYTQDLVNRIAYELSQGAINRHRNSIRPNPNQLSSKIRHLSEKHYQIVTVVDQAKDGDLRSLIDSYRGLSKMESVFLHQVLSLNQESDEVSALTFLRLMIGTARRILALHDDLRDMHLVVTSSGILTPEQEEILERTELVRRGSENDFRKLVSLLSEIDIRPAEKGL